MKNIFFKLELSVKVGANESVPVSLPTIYCLVLKTIQEAKNRGKKIEKAKFAFTNYEKALSNLKFALRGGEFDQRKFLVEMETLDGIVIDFGLNQEKFEKKFKKKWGE